MKSQAAYALLAMAFGAFTACRPSAVPSHSHVADIATDSTRSNDIYLFWKDADKLNRGRCEKDKPLLRHYCQLEVTSVVWPTLAAHMMEGREARFAQIKSDEAELIKHLAAIDEELKKNPGDFNLSADRTDTAKELSSTRSTRAGLEAEMALVNDFLVKLGTDTIVYRMVTTDQRYLAQKPLLEKLNRMFGHVGNPQNPPANPNPEPVPSQPAPVYGTTLWTDPVSGKVYIGIGEPQLFEYALASCRSIRPGKWDAIGPYMPDVKELTKSCAMSGSAEDGARLHRSPMMNTLPAMRMPDGSGAWVVWSHCGYIKTNLNLSPIILKFGPEGPRQHMTDKSTKLPVICEMLEP